MIDPAYLWIPPRVGSYGDEAIDLAEIAGRKLDEEQKLAVDAMLSYGPGGRWAALEAAIVEARQNGKTSGVLLPVTLFDLFLLPPDRIVWTAHLFRTSRDSFDDFVRCIETAPELSRRVKSISNGRGEEAIELHNGAKLEFLARSRGGGRGLGGKRVVMDEALILSGTAIGALMPTLSARPNPQISYGSSAAMETSDHLHSLTGRGRAGGDPTLVWIEWRAPSGWANPPCEEGKKCPHRVGAPGCALDDEALWQRANHALGVRLSVDVVRGERRSMPPREFGRERMGWEEDLIEGATPLDIEGWLRLTDRSSVPNDPIALGVEVNNDRSDAAIGIAARRGDGLIHLEVITKESLRGTSLERFADLPGISWVVPAAAALAKRWKPCAVVVDDRSEAAALLPDFKEAGLKVRDRDPDKQPGAGEVIVLTWASDMARACGQLYDAVTNTHTVRHLGQQELTESAKGAVWRPLGDARAWSRKEARTNPAPLIGTTLALHGLLTYGPADEGPPNLW